MLIILYLTRKFLFRLRRNLVGDILRFNVFYVRIGKFVKRIFWKMGWLLIILLKIRFLSFWLSGKILVGKYQAYYPNLRYIYIHITENFLYKVNLHINFLSLYTHWINFIGNTNTFILSIDLIVFLQLGIEIRFSFILMVLNISIL